MIGRKGKIWVWILVGILIVLIVGTVAGFFALKFAKKKASKIIQKKTSQMLAPARNKFLKMLPKNYNKERAQKIFDEFIKASQSGKISVNMVLKDLAPYLQKSVQDGKLSTQEADSVLKLMKEAMAK